MSTKKSLNQDDSDPVQRRSPFEYIVIVENNEADLFIHQTLLNTLSLGNRVEKRACPHDVLLELAGLKHISDVPDVLMVSLQPSEPEGFEFFDSFNKLPEFIRAKCKLIIVTAANSKEEKLRAIMNPSVIRYLEKPIDVINFKDFMFM